MARQEYPQELRDLIFELGSKHYYRVSYTGIRDRLSYRGYDLHEDAVRRLYLAERARRGEQPPMPERIRDNQRQRVYRLDNAIVRLIDDPVSDASNIRSVIRDAHAVYDLRWDGEIKLPEQGRRAYWHPAANQIELPPWARNRPTILHECAHSINDRLVRGLPYEQRQHASHGPAMVRIMVELLDALGVLDRAIVLRLADHHRVKVAASDSLYAPLPDRVAAREQTKE